MTIEGVELAEWPRARRLRLTARVAMALWIGIVIAFVILVGVRASDRVLSGLGVLASVFFATSFLAQAAAYKREWREMTLLAARHDLVAATRPVSRVRMVKDAPAPGGSGPAKRRERVATRPPSAPRR
jgi:hypothetical protein